MIHGQKDISKALVYRGTMRKDDWVYMKQCRPNLNYRFRDTKYTLFFFFSNIRKPEICAAFRIGIKILSSLEIALNDPDLTIDDKQRLCYYVHLKLPGKCDELINCICGNEDNAEDELKIAVSEWYNQNKGN
jgi:hypothetical protein